MKRLPNLYAGCAPLIDQRSNRVTGVISGLKFYDFLSPELNGVETFDLNWNNAVYMCIFFSSGSKVIKGVNRSNLFKQSDSRYMSLIKSSTGSNWMGDQIKLSTGSNWIEDHIRSSMASNWMGDHTSPII